MAVGNSLAKKRTQMYQNSQTAVYEVRGQKIELTPEIVKEYMVSGDKDRVSIKEVIMFMNLCKYSGLNPWAKEAYCIKYGNEPATMVVGKEAYMKRAEANDCYDGFEAGIIVYNTADGEIVRRIGSFRLSTEEIIGGWAKVWRKDKKHCYEAEVVFNEYAGRKKDGSLNSQWAKKPATMIRKVALVQALREAFPSSFGGIYSEEDSEFILEIKETDEPAPLVNEQPKAIEQHTQASGFSQMQVPPERQEEAMENMAAEENKAPEGQQTFFQ